MTKRRWAIGALTVAIVMLTAACSDVKDSGSSGSASGSAVPDNSGTTITFAINPWVGSAANVAVAQKLLEDKLGYTVETKKIDEYAQFPAIAKGQIDATLEVWPSGHAADYKKYIEFRQRGRGRWEARRDRPDRLVDPHLHAEGSS